MDRLKTWMDALRLLARQPESPNRVPLAEQNINGYLRAEGATWQASLDRLSDAIDKEAEPFLGTNHFWIVVKDFVCSKDDKD
jgi:hypothetical protein